MKIFITGKTGYIGSHLVEYFERHHEVIAPTHKELDLSDLTRELPKADVCIHAAWTYKENDTDLQIILRLVRNYPKVIIYGSGAEYGNRDRWFVKEDELDLPPCKGNSYILNKYAIYRAIKEIPNIVNLRLFGVIGEHEPPQRFFRSIITQALEWGHVPVKEAQKIMSWIDIQDVCKITDQILQNWNLLDHRDFNLCNSEIKCNYDWAYLTREMLGGDKYLLERLDDKPKDRYHGNNTRYLKQQMKFSKEIEFTPMVETIQRMIQYYKKVL